MKGISLVKHANLERVKIRKAIRNGNDIGRKVRYKEMYFLSLTC